MSHPIIDEINKNIELGDSHLIRDNFSSLGLASYNILYISIFGSRLYGTSNDQSDFDYKAIYLPSFEECVLNKVQDCINHSSNEKGKNTKDDIDIQVWSLQYWLYLLSKGDTHALDLLASIYSNMNVSKDFLFDFANDPLKLVNVRESTTWASYAHAQCYKYGIKGKRLNLVKNIREYVQDVHNDKVEPVLLCDIAEKFKDFDDMCFYKDSMLYLNGKAFMSGISLKEMLNRLDRMIETYGKRAKQASENDGIDWKAVYNAMRCLDQYIEMIETRKIYTYPMKTAEHLKRIKYGKLQWSEVEKEINEKLEYVNNRTSSLPKLETEEMKENHKIIILKNYKLYNSIS